MQPFEYNNRQSETVSLRVLLVLSVFLISTLTLRSEHCFRIWLKNKADNSASFNRPTDYLSEKSMERRTKFSIQIDSTDLPVSAKYIKALQAVGGTYLCQSRWANTVVMSADRYSIIEEYRKLPFVDSVQWVKKAVETASDKLKRKGKSDITNLQKAVYGASTYGAGWNQISLVNGQILHDLGYKGKNITIAVIDGGFLGVLNNPYLDQNLIKGTYNFVQPGQTVYGEHYHGSGVLSIMASNSSERMIGTAPEASYWLLNSEDGGSEYPLEEDFLVAAVEYADSLGVDLANISLGYTTFDESIMDHIYSDFFNPHLFVNIAMKQAAEKGLLIVNSAGNERITPWKKIAYPANSPYVMAVGAVNTSIQPGYFTSEGWITTQGVKPDICALGVATSFVYSDGNLTQGNGTSFASPVICGLMACLMQAFPNVAPLQWIERVRKYASHSASPQSLIGYGVPDFERIFQSMDHSAIQETVAPNGAKIKYITSRQQLVWDISLDNQSLVCRLYDPTGRLLRSYTTLESINLHALDKGIYTLTVQTQSERFSVKIVR